MKLYKYIKISPNYSKYSFDDFKPCLLNKYPDKSNQTYWNYENS